MKDKMTEKDLIVQAYELMARKCKYRPSARGDGFGNVYLDPSEIADPEILRKEAERYADNFISQNAVQSFHIGVSDYRTVRALVFAIEVARVLCAGRDFAPLAKRLLGLCSIEQHKSMTRKHWPPMEDK